MTDRRLLIGVDKGTSVVKTVVYDTAGTPLVSAHRRIRPIVARPGWHEEDPEETWSRTAETIRECIDALGPRRDDVAVIGVVGHMGGAWFVDRSGASVRNAIAWPDSRANDVVHRLESGPHHEEYLRICETAALPGMTMTLLAHLAQHEPELLETADLVLNAKDFITLRLTGRAVSEPSDAAFVPFDVDARAYSDRLLEILDATAWRNHFPELVPMGSIVGGITGPAATATGLPEGTPVVAGLGDAPAGMVGCGAVEVGESVSILGTSWLSATVVAEPHGGTTGIGWMYPLPNGSFSHFVANQSGASTLDWWLGKLAPEVIRGEQRDFAVLESEISAVAEATTPLTFLPYLSAAGLQAPFKAPLLRGTILGIEDATTRGDVFRAVYEGMVYAMKDCYSSFGHEPELIRLTGGGAKSSIWPGVLANVMGAPVELVTADEAATLGVALLGGAATGVWDSVSVAIKETTRVAERHEPDKRLYDAHQEQFRRFKRAQSFALDYYGSTD